MKEKMAKPAPACMAEFRKHSVAPLSQEYSVQLVPLLNFAVGPLVRITRRSPQIAMAEYVDAVRPFLRWPSLIHSVAYVTTMRATPTTARIIPMGRYLAALQLQSWTS